VILSDSLTIHIAIGCFTIRNKLSCIRSFFEGKERFTNKLISVLGVDYAEMAAVS